MLKTKNISGNFHSVPFFLHNSLFCSSDLSIVMTVKDAILVISTVKLAKIITSVMSLYNLPCEHFLWHILNL